MPELDSEVVPRAGLVTVPYDDVETPEDLIRLVERRLNVAFETEHTLIGESKPRRRRRDARRGAAHGDQP